MTGRPEVDRRIGAWLRDIPDDAAVTSPVDLAIARARHVRQRPLWLVALATPTSVVLDDHANRRRRAGALVLVVVLLVALVVAALALSGAPKRDPRLAIVVPSPQATMRAREPRPTLTPFPTLHPTPEPTPMTAHLVDVGRLGLQLMIRPGMSEPIIDMDTGVVGTSIAGFVGRQSMAIATAARGDALTIAAFGDTVVPCTDSATLRDRVATAFEIPNKAAHIEIDGQHGWQLTTIRQAQRLLIAGVVTATRCIVATSVAPATIPAFAEMPAQTDGGAVAFKAFLAEIRIVDPTPPFGPGTTQVAEPASGGFEVRCPDFWTVMPHVYGGDAPALTLVAGSAMSKSDPLNVVTITWEQADGTVELWDQWRTTSRRVAVDTLRELRQAVRGDDPFDTSRDVDLDGTHGVLMTVRGVPTLLVVRDRRAFVATVTGFLMPGKPSMLQTVIVGWRWTD
jgi:hypothetical protein